MNEIDETEKNAKTYYNEGGDHVDLTNSQVDSAVATVNGLYPDKNGTGARYNATPWNVGSQQSPSQTKPAQPSIENGDTIVKDGSGVTQFGSKIRIVDQKTGATRWTDLNGNAIATPTSEVWKPGMSWNDAVAAANGGAQSQEAKRLENQAKFMQQARDVRVKQNAEMHKEAYGVAKKAYDDLLGGGGVVKETKDGRKYRIVKIDGDMLAQTNADRLKMGRKDAISSVYATIALGKDGETPYGEPRFDFVMEQDGNVKSGGQKQWRTMTLDQVRANYGKALTNAGDKGGEDFAKSAFGSWGERTAELAKSAYQAQHPEVNFQRGTGRTFEEQMALEDRRIAAREALAKAERERREGELKDRQIKFIQSEVAKMRGSKRKNVAGAEEPAYTDAQIADRETELYGIFGLEKPQVGKGQEPKPQGESPEGGQAASSGVDNSGSEKWGSLTPEQIEKVKAKGGTYDEKTGEIVLPNGKRMKV